MVSAKLGEMVRAPTRSFVQAALEGQGEFLKEGHVHGGEEIAWM